MTDQKNIQGNSLDYLDLLIVAGFQEDGFKYPGQLDLEFKEGSDEKCVLSPIDTRKLAVA